MDDDIIFHELPSGPPFHARVGIPEHYILQRIFYARHSQLLVTLARAGGSNPPFSRLFYRRVYESKYQLVTGISEHCSIQSGVMARGKGSIIFSVFRFALNGGILNGDWEGIFSLDELPKLMPVLRRQDIVPPQPYLQAMILDINNIDETTEWMECSVRLSGAANNEDCCAICDLNLITGRLDLLCKLYGARF